MLHMREVESHKAPFSFPSGVRHVALRRVYVPMFLLSYKSERRSAAAAPAYSLRGGPEGPRAPGLPAAGDGASRAASSKALQHQGRHTLLCVEYI